MNIKNMKKKEDQNIEPIKSELNDDYTNDDLYNIESWGADLSFRELITMYDEEELVKPELQRKYVWDKIEASRFIDSLLLGLPVPSIFLAKQVDEKKIIVDGYQRIMTVYDYCTGIFSKDGKIFNLSNSDRINERWRGKAFKELTTAEQRKIKATTIHAIIFQQKEPEDGDTSLYQVFERINTSGQVLKPQEIRNCIYQGKFNSLLFELNKNETWRKLYGLKREDSRMRDLEFILRFFALSSSYIKSTTAASISLKQYLNEFMGSEESHKEEVLLRRREDFLKVMDFIYNNFGEEAFRNVSPTDPNKILNRFHPTIFDSIAIATLMVLEKDDSVNYSDLKNKKLALLNDEDFKDCTTIRTTNIPNIRGRISKAMKYLYDAEYE